MRGSLRSSWMGTLLTHSPEVVRIASAVNESYILPLAVMVESIRQNLSTAARVELYLIHGGIEQSSIQAISSLVETRAILLAEEQLAAAPRDPRFPSEAAIPLLLAEVMPASIDRVLFLDADTLVLGDLAELWETLLDGHVVGAVADAAVPLCSDMRGVKGWQRMGIPHNAPYFNCGVLLIDIQRWRAREVTKRARQYLECTAGRVDFLHQEALNAVLWDDWQALDGRWNLLGSHAGRPFDTSGTEAWRNPGIVHFAGRVKPWRVPAGGVFGVPYRKALEGVRGLVPSPMPGTRDRLYSVYDRYLRDSLYRIERYLWRRRLI